MPKPKLTEAQKERRKHVDQVKDQIFGMTEDLTNVELFEVIASLHPAGATGMSKDEVGKVLRDTSKLIDELSYILKHAA